jgi:hypothetical protein
MRSCSIDGCAKPINAGGLCKMHYERRRRHGDPLKTLKARSIVGAPRAWINDHVGHLGQACLIWPFARHRDGRAHIHGAKPTRIMCELAHGPSPSPRHEAAHSCGKAHAGCVNPRHLRWATPAENAEDKVRHGTLIEGDSHYAAKLSSNDVQQIRARARSEHQTDLATEFGVSLTCINKIVRGRSWKQRGSRQ